MGNLSPYGIYRDNTAAAAAAAAAVLVVAAAAIMHFESQLNR
jgi:hypothetical protein